MLTVTSTITLVGDKKKTFLTLVLVSLSARGKIEFSTKLANLRPVAFNWAK